MTNSRITSWQVAVVLLRAYLGWSWFVAGWEKVWSPAWRGTAPAVTGFLQGALKGSHFDWYRGLIESLFLPNAGTLAFLVSWGEVLVGLALLAGLFVNLAAAAGIVMNVSFLLAGSVSTNATYVIMELILIATGAGLIWGLDGFVAKRWGWNVPILNSRTTARTAPGLSWSLAVVLGILGITALVAAGAMDMAEFNNPAGQLSRLLIFSAGFFGIKAWIDSRKNVLAAPEMRRAA